MKLERGGGHGVFTQSEFSTSGIRRHIMPKNFISSVLVLFQQKFGTAGTGDWQAAKARCITFPSQRSIPRGKYFRQGTEQGENPSLKGAFGIQHAPMEPFRFLWFLQKIGLVSTEALSIIQSGGSEVP